MKSLAVAIVGDPNVGKSLLTNRLVGSLTSAVSPKYNTTRTNVLGIRTKGHTQIVFTDTPGLVDTRSGTGYRYVKELVTAAADAVPTAEIMAYIADVSSPWDDHTQLNMSRALDLCAAAGSTPVLVANKVDLMPRGRSAAADVWSDRLAAIEDDFESAAFRAGAMGPDGFDGPNIPQPFYVSALHRSGLTSFVTYLESQAVDREWDFPGDMTTPQSPKELATEIIREKLFRNLHKEVPYSIVQTTRAWYTPPETGVLHIDQDLAVGHKGQVKMLLARGAGSIRAITRAATAEIEAALGVPVKLTLHVTTRNKVK